MAAAGGFRLFRPNTLQQGLILVVLASLIPIAIVSILQGAVVLEGTRIATAARLSSAAQAVAERERDPFIIARHSLTLASRLPEVVDMSPTCSNVMRAALLEPTALVNFSRIDAGGYPRCSARALVPGLNSADTQWWQDGIHAQGFTVGGPIYGRASRQLVLVVMLPLLTPEGEQNGAVTAAVSMPRIRQSLDNAVKGTDSVAALVNKDGEVLLSSGDARFSLLPIGTSDEGPPSIMASNGREYYYSIASLEGDDLFIAYAEPKNTLFGNTISQQQWGLLLPILGLFLASLAIWFGADRLAVRWFRQLRLTSRQIASGNYAVDISQFAGAPEEVAALSADMQFMAKAIDARDADLTKALEVKTELTREVHHRVKNNLQIVMSLLTMQAARLTQPDAREALAQTRSRIAALSLIHRLLYQQDEQMGPAKVGVNNLMVELCQQLRAANRAHANVDLICDIGPQDVDIDQAVPLALFAVEAVTNAYRHAFAEDQKGEIRMEFKVENGLATLTIRDNGRGYDHGSTDEQMGAELMRAFADQLGGEAQVSTGKGNGTSVRIVFPVVP